MNCCENKNIVKENEMNFCYNCGTIHDYDIITNKNYNMIINNSLLESHYIRIKYLRKRFNNLDNNVIRYLNECLNKIKILKGLNRISINNYLNPLYNYYCQKSNIKYNPLIIIKDIKLDNTIICFINESIENIRLYLDIEKLPLSTYINIVYTYYCKRYKIEYIPLFKSEKKININYKIICLINKSIKNIKLYLNIKNITIHKYLNIIYKYYCKQNEIEYNPLIVYDQIILDNKSILNKIYNKYPYIIKVEEEYDFDTVYL